MRTTLKALMTERGITQQQLADTIGVSRAAVSKWQRLGVDSVANLQKIASALGIPVSYLTSGADSEKAIAPVTSGLIRPGYVRIPVYDVSGSCGSGCANNGGDLVTGAVDLAQWFIQSLPGVVSARGLQIIASSGDSMTPTIEERSLVIVDTAQTAFRSDGIYCLRVDGELFIKRIMRNLDGTLTLISDNPRYPQRTIDRAALPETAIIGRVVFAFNGRNI